MLLGGALLGSGGNKCIIAPAIMFPGFVLEPGLTAGNYVTVLCNHRKDYKMGVKIQAALGDYDHAIGVYPLSQIYDLRDDALAKMVVDREAELLDTRAPPPFPLMRKCQKFRDRVWPSDGTKLWAWQMIYFGTDLARAMPSLSILDKMKGLRKLFDSIIKIHAAGYAHMDIKLINLTQDFSYFDWDLAVNINSLENMVHNIGTVFLKEPYYIFSPFTVRIFNIVSLMESENCTFASIQSRMPAMNAFIERSYYGSTEPSANPMLRRFFDSDAGLLMSEDLFLALRKDIFGDENVSYNFPIPPQKPFAERNFQKEIFKRLLIHSDLYALGRIYYETCAIGVKMHQTPFVADTIVLGLGKDVAAELRDMFHAIVTKLENPMP